MKHILLTTIAAVVLVGCATTQSPEPTPSKASGISIHQAVFDGNIEAIKQHLDAGANNHLSLVDAKDDKFVGTFLHWAAAGGQNEIVELLIAKGADVNATDGDGDTPLHLAGNSTATKEIAELLIAKGADVNAMNGIGKTPLDLAIGSRLPGETDGANRLKHPEIADLLRQHGGKTLGELLSN